MDVPQLDACQCVPYERCDWCAENCTRFDSNDAVEPWVWNGSPTLQLERDEPQPWAYVQNFEVDGIVATFRFQTIEEYEAFEKDHCKFRQDNLWGADLIEKMLNRENIISCCIEQDQPHTYEQLIFNTRGAFESFAEEHLNPV